MILYLPYSGALVSGKEASDYLRFLGFRRRPIAEFGYDTISLDRIRGGASASMPQNRAPFLFVGRLIEKKGLDFLLQVYAEYRRVAKSPRDLRVLGDGPERDKCEELVSFYAINEVHFLGAGGQSDVAAEMATAHALLVPSKYEEWGLIVNEALAFSLPIIVSSTVGASKELVRNLVNGIIASPNDANEWIAALLSVDEDEALYKKLVSGVSESAQKADVVEFRRAVLNLVAGNRD
ncbi:glycosyltransferase [Algiphilus aromaticivorans]|uniref:glycosyltransferase n=1 Tax=Algiphilus aromaticivorans TaxID=382454 RepID=UPI0018DC0DF5|nr:glycosyltransferase [Algiphilus aromaticivorans]